MLWSFQFLAVVVISLLIDYMLLKLGIPSNSQAPPNRKERTKNTWDGQPIDSVLTNVLLNQHVVGNHSPNGWKAPAYTVVINAIKKDCDVTITKDNIIFRLLNNHYETVNKIENKLFSWIVMFTWFTWKMKEFGKLTYVKVWHNLVTHN